MSLRKQYTEDCLYKKDAHFWEIAIIIHIILYGKLYFNVRTYIRTVIKYLCVILRHHRHQSSFINAS